MLEGGALTWLSMPNISSMEKKRMAQRGEMGSWVTASGYARNASPGPVGERASQTKGIEHLWCTHIPSTLPALFQFIFSVSVISHLGNRVGDPNL